MSDLMENANGRAEGIGAPAGALEKAVAFDFDKIEDTAPQVVETPSKHDASLLDEYGRAGHGGKLIRLTGKHPVGRWRDLPSIGVEGGKRWMAVNRRAKLTPDRRPILTPFWGTTVSARPGGAGRGCAARSGALVRLPGFSFESGS